MDKIIIEDVIIKRQKIIKKKEGNVLKFLNKNDNEFYGFGEAYFSIIRKNAVKAWRKHKEMTCNLIVPHGDIKIVMIDDRSNNIGYQEIELSQKNYLRITIPPGIWTGFKGLSFDESVILNFSNIPHDPNEQVTVAMNNFDYKW